MDNFHALIDQMVTDISTQAAQLEAVRLQLFLAWLKSHSSKIAAAHQIQIEIQAEENPEIYLKNGLKAWFESLPIQGLLWEYNLLLGEIAWWRALDSRTLARILKSEGKD